MSSSGNLSHWRFVNQLRLYLSRNTPGVSEQALTKDVGYTSDSVKLNASDSKTEVSKDVKVPVPVIGDPNTTTGGNWRQMIDGLAYYVPLILQTTPSEPPKKEQLPAWRTKKKSSISQSSVDAKTRHLFSGIMQLSNNVLPKRIRDICLHLRNYPFTKNAAVNCSAIPSLVKLVETCQITEVQENAREALTLLGYSGPLKGRGINILSIDGGGVRGLVAIELLRELEEKSGKKIHELFDYICGVSTGAIVAVLVGAHRLSMEDCTRLYQNLSNKIFARTTMKGTAGLVWKNSFYDSDIWANILKENIGDMLLTETARKPGVPKISMIATQVDTSLVKGYLFRNYALPSRVGSHYEGTHKATLWECVRASAAAPGYFSEFKVNDTFLLDGGVMVNNPTAIAVHEARLLWPKAQFQTVVSLGTGRHDPPKLNDNERIGWGARIRTIINSATDTEAVHAAMHDLLPIGTYYRLNPYLSETIRLDEIRPEKLSLLVEDTQLYLRRNEIKVSNAVTSLKCTKNLMDKVSDYCDKRKLMWSAR